MAPEYSGQMVIEHKGAPDTLCFDPLAQHSQKSEVSLDHLGLHCSINGDFKLVCTKARSLLSVPQVRIQGPLRFTGKPGLLKAKLISTLWKNCAVTALLSTNLWEQIYIMPAQIHSPVTF